MRTILVLMDTVNLRYLDFYQKNATGITPNLSAFARECVVYDRHWIGSAPCMPARRDIFTGRTQFLERGWGGIEPFDTPFPQILRRSNVVTHMITDHTHYFEMGGENYCQQFDTWEYLRGQEFDAWISKVNKPAIPDTYGRQSVQYALNKTRFTEEAEYPTPKTFRAACRWAEENRNSDDFFLMVESFDPHEPFDTPKEYRDLYNDCYDGKDFFWPSYAPVTEPPEAVAHLEKCYLATLTMVDRWFGKFMESLKQNGLYDDTMILFTTDHGHMLGEHGFTGKNFMHAYNELAHIPLLIRLPQAEHAGEHVQTLTQNIDLMPTILERHGCKVPATVKGRSLLKTLAGSVAPREQVVYGWFGRAVNVFDGAYTYFRAPKSKGNEPLYIYCGVPSTIWRYYTEEYADHIEMGRYLPYTHYPVYRIPPLNNDDISGDIGFVSLNALYDFQQDYIQQHPLMDAALERRMIQKLIAGMEEAQSPDEQYERLGLENWR